jgi:hypothetical protein
MYRGRAAYTAETMKVFSRLLLFVLMLWFAIAAEARVVRVEVLSRTPIVSAEPGVPAYEQIWARAHFAVNPENAHNRAIVDLDKAEKGSHNRLGEVFFDADLFLMRPVSNGNGAMLLEIPNRGGTGLLSLVDGGRGQPESGADVGDAWLLKQGFTFASLGWQWDVAPGARSLRLYPPHAYEPEGKRISGLLRDDFTPTESSTEVPLGHIMGARLGGTEYSAGAPDDARNVLTVRDSPHGPRTVIPRTQWSFTHTVDGKPAPNSRFLHLDSGFVPGRIYELVYVVYDPVVAGLGFAAVRDFVSWMKHSPDAIAPVKVVYGAGISQCGRFLRDMLYQGFNADESGQMALDGVLAHVGGAGRGEFNYRFAQPSRDAQPMSSIDWPTDIFPFTDEPESDPAHPTAPKAGLLDLAKQQHVMPKIFFSHTSYEYWGRAASLIHTTADGKADASIGPNVRIYYYSGLQHFSVNFPPEMTGWSSQQLPSPLPIRWFWRAMIANMDAWVRSGKKPPASRYPKIADGTLVTVEKLAFPAVPGLNSGLKPPATHSQGWDLDFGPDWRAGILVKQPPEVGYDYLALVPQVDADGNDLGGIRLPEIVAPLATYTGWNLRVASIGAPTERLAFLGSFVPLRKTAAEAAQAHDPRAAIESRYKDYAEYRAQFQKAVDGLVGERYILAEDGAQLMERSRTEWDWCNSFWERN